MTEETTSGSPLSQAQAGKPQPAAKRIGVLMPAGKVLNHDQVVTYTYDDPEKSATQFSNIGDLFVYESSLRILSYENLMPLSLSEKDRDNPEYIERLNSLDYIFLRGSNYINTSGNWDSAIALLEKVKVPVVAFGIGVQTPDNATRYVNDSTERFLKLIAERSKSLAIRGELSATALESIGIKNARIIGCPTVFRHRKPTIQLRKVAAADLDSLGFTLRRKTYGNATLQRYLLRTLSELYRLSIFCAGELEEKAIVYAGRNLLKDSASAKKQAVQALIDEKWLYGPKDPLLGLYERSMNVYESVGDFERGIAEMAGVTGFRLHGNLLALANGVPALYMVYDTRTREFVKTLGIPSVETKSMDRFSFEQAWDSAKFDVFEKTYARRYKELLGFLEENNLPHRLESAAKPERPTSLNAAA